VRHGVLAVQAYPRGSDPHPVERRDHRPVYEVPLVQRHLAAPPPLDGDLHLL